MKRSKLKKGPLVKKSTPIDVESIYKIKALFADAAYVTIVVRNKSVFLRLTFAETKMDIGGHSPVAAVMMEIGDIQNLYNHIGTHLQKLRELKIVP